jgi:DNA-binding MarR family transcriptional regulator
MDEPSEPQWLNDEERQAWLTLMTLQLQLGAALDVQLRRSAGISHFQYTVLAVLSEAPDRTRRLSDIATFTDGSLPRLSMAVARLEEQGWVRRSPDPTDGRYTLATLTDAGWEKVVETAPGHVGDVRRLVFDPLTKAQVHQLHTIGQRILRAIAADDPAANRRT